MSSEFPVNPKGIMEKLPKGKLDKFKETDRPNFKEMIVACKMMVEKDISKELESSDSSQKQAEN